MASWVEAVKAAIARHLAATGSPVIVRRDFIAAELDAIVAATGTVGRTPAQTLGRELQQLRDAGYIAFGKRGTYRWPGPMPAPQPVAPSHAVLVARADAGRAEPLAEGFAFAERWLLPARRAVGEWVIYQNADGYHATARVERIEPGRGELAGYRAAMVAGSYLEFGRAVPLRTGAGVIEQALIDPNGALDLTLARQTVRTISRENFDRILGLRLVEDDELLPRDAVEDAAIAPLVAEERAMWDGPLDRATVLTSRKVRNRQFRARVLDAYGSRCALTGMKLINGGGRAETQAAHIMSVEAGGPDAVDNGIALSGTVHWMFDRGLIALSDRGDILLSRAINDLDSVERLIHQDRKARLPSSPDARPHPRYLDWHRTVRFHD